MNIKHYISAATLALVALGFSACDGKDEPDYKGAATPSATERVFFAEKTMTKNIDEDDNAFTVKIYRPENATDGELTVQILATSPEAGVINAGDAPGLFTISKEVKFLDGEPSANITIDYDANAMAPNTPYPVSLAVDDAHANEYGIASMNLYINKEVYTPWAPFGYDEELGRDGQGEYTFTVYFTGSDNVQVLSRSNPTDPKIMQFQFQWLIDNDDPSKGWETFMTAETSDGGKTIQVPEQPFAENPNYGMVYVADTYTYYGEEEDKGLSNFNPETGQFTLNVMYYVPGVGSFGDGDEYLVLNGYLDTNDYTISIHDAGQVQIGGVDYSVIGFEMTESVAFINYTLVKGELSEEEVEEVAEAINKQAFPADEEENAPAAQADEETPEYEINTLTGGSQNVTFSFPSSATYTIVAVGYKAAADEESNPEMKSTASLTFDFKAADPFAGWSLVTEDATWTENLIPYFFGEDFEPVDVKVRIDKSDDFEGLYRISNPYANYPDEELVADCVAEFGCIEYDLSDPEKVLFPLSETGFVDEGDELAIVSYGYMMVEAGIDPAEVPAKLLGKATSAGDVTLAATGSENDPSFLAYFGAMGPYLCDVDFSLKGATQAAPAEVAPRKVAHVGKKAVPAAKRFICPARYHVKSTKAVKAAKAAAGKKALDRTAVKTGLRRR